MSSAVFEVGTILAGKYRIDAVLGQGGMGMVVAATHVHLNQKVALKFLLPELVHDRSVVERFAREARSSAQLRGEHVCRVSDVGALENGAPYIVMELLSGRDLSSMIAGNGPLPIAIACDYLLQACLGLAEAHALGIVHRDLKPANLFLTKRPEGTPLIKVLDFGIAKAQSENNFSLTQTSSVMGSPGYMSPEQLRSSKDADQRSDIWALGVILYELVSGRVPFTGETLTDLALRVSLDPTPPLAVGGPRGFDAAIYRCLEKDPNRRFPDVAAFAQALKPFASPSGREVALNVGRVLHGATSEPDRPSATSATTPTTLGSSTGAIGPGQGSGRVPWAVVAVAAVVVVVIMVLVTKSKRGRENDATVTSGSAESATPAPPTTPTATVGDASTVLGNAPVPMAVIDASVINPIDAAAPDAAVRSVVVARPDAGVRPDAAPPDAGVPKPKPTRPKPESQTQPPKDYGSSRF